MLDELEAGSSKAILKKQKSDKIIKNGGNSSSKAKKKVTSSQGKLPKLNGKHFLGDVQAKNNNATILPSCKTRSIVNKMNKVAKIVKKKVTPIIQTRGMKAKAKIAGSKNIKLNATDLARETVKFNQIDSFTADEFQAGDNEISHDGVELSVNGSDLEDFPDKNDGTGQQISQDEDDQTQDSDGEADLTEQELAEPSELSDSDSDQDIQGGGHLSHPKVASKVVKVPVKMKRVIQETPKSRSDKFAKFSHLRQDPDFRLFLNEVIDNHMGVKEPETGDRD